MTAARLARFARVVTPLALLALAGSAVAQPLTFSGTYGPNWTAFGAAGVCNGTSPLQENNFGLTNCFFAPPLPGSTNSIFLGSNTVVLNIGASVASVDLGVGGSFALGGDLNSNGGIFQNDGTVSGDGGNRSLFNTIFNNAGTFNWPGATLYFQTLSLANTGTINYDSGNWPNWTGTNSFTMNGGSLNKNTAGNANISVATELNAGTLNVNDGNLQFSSNSVAFAPGVVVNVAAPATLQFTAESLRGTLNSSPAGFLGQVGSCSIPASQSLTLNVAGTGWRMSGGDLQMNGSTLTNKALYILDATNKSFFNATFINDVGATLRSEGATTYFQTLAMTNHGLIQANAGNWPNWTGNNSFTQSASGTLRKIGPNSLTVSVPSTFNGGLVDVQQGDINLNSTQFVSTAAVTWNASSGASIQFTSANIGGTFNGNVVGTMGNNASVGLLPGGATLSLTGSGWTMNSDLQFNTRTLTNSGVFTSGVVNRSLFNGTLNNTSTGRFKIDGGVLYFQTMALNNAGLAITESGSWPNWTGTNSITNTGTFRKTTAGVTSITVPFTHSAGRIEALGGTLVLEQTGLTVAPGAQWQVDNGAAIRFRNYGLNGTIAAAPVGFLGSDGALNVNAAGGLTLNVSGAGWQWEAGDIQGNGRTITNQGLFASANSNKSLSSTTFVNALGATYRNTGATTYFQTCAFTNAGTFEYLGGEILNWTGTNSFTNTGTLNRTGVGVNNFSVSTVNSGTVNVSGGGLQSLNYRQTAGTTNLNASTMGSSTPLLLEGGSFIGTGNAGPITNSGAQLDINPPGLEYIGTLALSGPYVNSGLGTLIIDIDSTTVQDRLTCQGRPTINGGTLRLRVPGGVDLTGLVFEIVRGTQPASGAFTTATVNISNVQVRTYAQGNSIYAFFPCNGVDIADDQGNAPPQPGIPNNGVTEGDYNAFFSGFFDALAYCDIADDQGNALPAAPDVPNNGVTEGDYNFFFSVFFDGCEI